MTTSARTAGRPLNTAIDQQLLEATQELLIEEGYERLTMDEVARRCGASKATIYRRWPSKIALVVAATAALFQVPQVPDTGDLREDLMLCAVAYVRHDARAAQVLASVLSASRHDPALREASRTAVGAPHGGLFDVVLSRAVQRGLIDGDVDIEVVARVFPAIAYEELLAHGRLVGEHDVRRLVDAILLPALPPPSAGSQ